MHVILTGSPGVGKTTLVQKVCQVLQDRKVNLNGFYTTEERDRTSNKRVGFNVTSIDGQHAARLAHVSSCSSIKVGTYGVEVSEFEKVALPAMKMDDPGILVLDEIGKMEMFSDSFKAQVIHAFSSAGVTILATIPIAKGKPIQFLEAIRNRSDIKLFTVDKVNRNFLCEEIVRNLTD